MSETNVVPFGKYKGQPIEILFADPQYREWLIAQPWFREKFVNIYNVIINNVSDQSFDTPEHNAMQIKFLDPKYCLECLLKDEIFANKYDEDVKVYTRTAEPNENELIAKITAIEYDKEIAHEIYKKAQEAEEIAYKVAGDRIYMYEHLLSDKDKNNKIIYHNAKIATADAKRIYEDFYDKYSFISRALETKRYADRKLSLPITHITLEYKNWDVYLVYDNNTKILIELKPGIGDDYPAILRKILSRIERAINCRDYIAFGSCYVMTYKIDATSANIEQIKKMFMAHNITLLII